MPSKQLHNKVLAGGCETAKHHGPEGRNNLQKMLSRGLTSLLDSGKNKVWLQLLGLLLAAAGPAAAAAGGAAAAAGGA